MTLALALGLGGCASWSEARRADGGEAPSASAAAPALRLKVDAPGPLKALLERYLDLARLQAEPATEALDPTEGARLAAAAPAQVRELLQTEGYFEPKVQVQRSDGQPPEVSLKVEPGPRVVVRDLKVQVRGALQQAVDAGDAQAAELARALAQLGPLKSGSAFRSEDWADTKRQVLVKLRAEGYAAASMADSAAEVQVEALAADLSLAADSGPRFLAGTVQVRGLQQHDADMVRQLAGFGPGTPLTEAVLLDYQTRLQQTGLFDAVTVTFSPQPEQAGAAELVVRLVERSLQQATVGVGYSNESGPRLTLEHTHRRLLGKALTAHNKLELGRLHQYWAGEFQTHPGENFVRWLAAGQLERTVSSTDTVWSQRLRLGRTQDTPRIERIVFGELLRSRRSDGAGAVSSAEAISANVHVVWRDLDSVLLPTRGMAMTLQTAAGQARSDAEIGPFGRLYGRATVYWPFGDHWYAQARIEVAQVFKRNSLVVPDALTFRAGGDESVRGYSYRSLAPTDAAGNAIGGNVLLTGSAEIARPILASMPALWGAVFVDAGNAAMGWGSWKADYGVGAGVRWRSPIGPLKVDIAYGEALRKFRLHFTVGVVF